MKPEGNLVRALQSLCVNELVRGGNDKKPVIGIGGCLGGSAVPFDGGHKRK